MPVATTTKSKPSSEMPSSPDSMTDETNCEMKTEINVEINVKCLRRTILFAWAAVLGSSVC